MSSPKFLIDIVLRTSFVGLFCQAPSLAGDCVEWLDHRPPPGPRFGHAMAYDSARGVTVTFGGENFLDLFGDTWEWDSTSWTQRSTSGPTKRKLHSIAYDDARGVSVLFGGNGYWDLLGDTWEWDGTQWLERITEGPPARSGHAMVYDSSRDVVVLFGGRGPGLTYFGDTWEWDGTTWTLRSTTGPSSRSFHAMSYDSARGVVVLSGGFFNNGESTFFGDTWEWNGTVWTLRSESGPAPGRGHAMAYDSDRGVTVLFGGDWGSDTWEWDGSSWTLRTAEGPLPRSWHAMAYDSNRSVTVLVGGLFGLGDTWEWDGTTWHERVAPGIRPIEPIVAYDSARGVTVMVARLGEFEGTRGDYVHQTWEWDGEAWVFRSNSIVDGGPQSAEALVFDSGRGVSVLFARNSDQSETWEWDGTSWTLRSTGGPPPRWGGAMTYDSYRQVTLLFGGLTECDASYTICTFLNDTWAWDGVAWTQVGDDGPSPRGWSSMAFDSMRGVAVLFGGNVPVEGGFSPYGPTDDTWEWDGTTWAYRTAVGPSFGSNAGMAYDTARGTTVLFGGLEVDISAPHDTWEWDGTVWTKRIMATPPAKFRPRMAYDSDRRAMVMVGVSYSYGETWELINACDCNTAPVRPVAERYTNCSGECYALKNRYLSFVAPAAPGCGSSGVALRVTLGPMPGPTDCPSVPDFSAVDGEQMWVGDEVLSATGAPTGIYQLQSAPLFRDWTTVPGRVIQVSDCNVVPCATYTIDAITDVDYPTGPYSTPLVLQTTRMWGDVIGVGGSSPADGNRNANDITGVVDCMKEIPTAAPTAWCDLIGRTPTGGGDGKANVLDLTAVVDALKELDYLLPGPTAPDPCAETP